MCIESKIAVLETILIGKGALPFKKLLIPPLKASVFEETSFATAFFLKQLYDT